VLRDVEFVQFHPTVLWSPGASGQRPLITEALRGAGAVLVDSAGRPVMTGRHPLGDLAPRDVVAAAMHEAGGGGPLWLDARGVGRSRLEAGFPTVTAACRAHGIDPVADLIPVAPGAHYACGGIRADMSGRTSLAGVYAVGEVAGTGVHGANRLASNSLTEAMITGRRVGELLGAELPMAVSPCGASSGGVGPCAGVGVLPAARAGMAAAMARDAGVVRDAEGLGRLLSMLDRVRGSDELDLATVEATNLHTVSVLVATAAAGRAESRGCHRRRDFPAPDPLSSGRHTTMRWSGHEPALIG
jgi:L-aspartate oxidase